MKRLKWLAAAILLMLAAGCGGGGGGSNGGGSAVSGHVPYLISTPTVSYKLSSFGTGTAYDVTVTLQADGPTGVYAVGLWILDASDNSNFDYLDLSNVPSTKIWTATTYSWNPVPSGQYYIDSITLDYADLPSATYWRSGWYSIMPIVSNDFYFVDESEITTIPTLTYLFSNVGLTSFPVTRFTLP